MDWSIACSMCTFHHPSDQGWHMTFMAFGVIQFQLPVVGYPWEISIQLTSVKCLICLVLLEVSWAHLRLLEAAWECLGIFLNLRQVVSSCFKLHQGMARQSQVAPSKLVGILLVDKPGLIFEMDMEDSCLQKVVNVSGEYYWPGYKSKIFLMGLLIPFRFSQITMSMTTNNIKWILQLLQTAQKTRVILFNLKPSTETLSNKEIWHTVPARTFSQVFPRL